MFRIELHTEADKELKEAYDWYEGCSAGLGSRFINIIDIAFKTIATYPDRHGIKKIIFGK